MTGPGAWILTSAVGANMVYDSMTLYMTCSSNKTKAYSTIQLREQADAQKSWKNVWPMAGSSSASGRTGSVREVLLLPQISGFRVES